MNKPVGIVSMRGASVGLGIALMLLMAQPVLAQDALPAPRGPVILTISGNIAVSNRDGAADFDREMLVALGMTSVETTTAWTDGPQKFQGVLARAVLQRVGARGTTVIATALNDFVAPIPMEELQRYDVILAMVMNGAEMQVSDKGPLWVVYPRNDHPELLDPKLNDRWVWQLRSLAVE